MSDSISYSVSLAFENISLPPFQDVLIITAKSPHGKIGITGSLNLLQPDQFEVLEIKDELVEVLIVNKRILKRVPKDVLLGILEKRVFPFIVKGEIVKVDFKVRMSYENLEVKVNKPDEA